MRTCKACNEPFEPKQDEKFCSAFCVYEYEQRLRRNGKGDDKTPANKFLFESVLKRTGQFIISQQTLNEIYADSIQKTKFEMLLASQELMVVRLDNEMSVIKKSIL